MSRIHEALKKAAQERSAKQSEGFTADIADLSAERIATETPVVRTTISVPAQTMPSLSELSAPTVRPEIEQFLAHCVHPEWKPEPKLNVFDSAAKSLAGLERFRTLRSRLLQISTAQPLQRILVTSSVPEEGKTFVAANLAQSFIRQSGRRVLLIDADMRASRLHLHFGVPQGPGLSEYLKGEAELTQVVQVNPEGNLCLIPGGGHVTNASELVHSEKMKNMLESVSRLFDWVILDSPPALAVYDASILADMCDGVLFVVRAGYTEFSVAERASGEFKNKNLLGVVLNRVDDSETYGGHYYYDVTPEGAPRGKS